MADAKTIDNLGPQAHKDYMNALKLLGEKDVSKVFKSSDIAKRAETLTVTPSPQKADELFDLNKNESSPFVPPYSYFITTSDIFTHDIIPSLGDENNILNQLKNLNALPKNEDDEKKALTSFFESIKMLNEINKEIRQRKNEYTKG